MSINDQNSIFYSKILLFGEYSILFDSNGLTIPYTHFNGQLSHINKNSYTDINFAVKSNLQLKSYASYLSTIKDDIQLDLRSLKEDINKGLYFESSIPEGYGLGSSGALVAAIYTSYCSKRVKAKVGLPYEKIKQLKKIFSLLESYFHGKSSGIDPLICYLKHPLLIKNQEKIKSIGISRNNIEKEDAVFIINTHQTGKTEPLVDLFLAKCKSSNYKEKIIRQLIPTTNDCIQNLLSGNIESFYKSLNSLSKFQLHNFKEMIPETFIPYWKNGIKHNKYLLKLCGSGGGGFLLGFTRNFSETKNYFQKHEHEIIPVYKDV